jgi:hypothetical protein
MNQLQTAQLAGQHIRELHQDADHARLARGLQAHRTPRRHADPASTIAGARSAIRHWFERAQLGPANNYVAR